MPKYEIFANHAHVFPSELRPEGTVDALRRCMDACGIARAVCFAPFDGQFARINRTDMNRWLAGEITGDDRFVGFGTIDFTRDNLTAQVDEIAALGFKGIKIHPASQEIHVLGAAARKVYAAAERLGLFISFHTGIHRHRLSDYQPILFDDLNWDYPALRFSMEHIGGHGFFREALAVLANGKYGFAGWTSIAAEEKDLSSAWTLTDAELCTVVHQLGVHRSVFGLDFPFKKVPEISASIARFSALPISEEAKSGLFGGNLTQILDI